MQQPFTANVFPDVKSLKRTSGNSQMTLFAVSQYQTYLSGVRLVQGFPWLGKESGLMAIAEACFLRDSDCFDYSKFRVSSLRMLKGFLVVAPTQSPSMQLELFSDTNLEVGESQSQHIRSRSSLRNYIKARILSEYSGSLEKWGIAAPGSSATATAGCPKIDHEFSLLVVTGHIQCCKVEPNRPTLRDCLDNCNSATILDQHRDGNRFYHDQSPTLVTPSGGTKFAVIYRSSVGDRAYTEEAPTLRSLSNTGGKHQGGSGAWKVVKYKGEDYLVSSQCPEEACSLASSCSHLWTGARPRKLKDGKAALIPISYRRQRPLSATEFERLMGWPVCSTERGITPDGKELTISKTQRQKMLENGIIPQGIEDICNKLKDFLAPSSQSSQSAQQSIGEDLHTSLDW